MIKLLGISSAVLIFLFNSVYVIEYSQINLDIYGQSSSTNETRKQSPVTNVTQEQQSTVTVTKIVHCDSSLGLPNDDAVCKFVLDNVDSSQFDMIMTGNKSGTIAFQGSVNGTKISLEPGNYTISENPYDTTDIENQLGDTALVNMLTDTNGDCLAQFSSSQPGSFKEATGTIGSGGSQSCEIINTVSVAEGDSPEDPLFNMTTLK